jgi:DNA-binding transcriptional ArsR family regulator
VKPNIQQSDVFKALAHNKRLNIVYLLSKGEMTVGEIHCELKLSQSNISQHLMFLRDAKIVKTRKVGKNVHYSLSHKSLSEANKLINEITKLHRISS